MADMRDIYLENWACHHYIIDMMMTKTYPEFYAHVRKAYDGKWAADVFYADGRVFMRNYLYNYKTKIKLLLELQAVGVELR